MRRSFSQAAMITAFTVLLLWPYFGFVYAQVSDLSNVEQSNVGLVGNNLRELADYISGNFPNTAEVRGLVGKLKEMADNIKTYLDNGKIRSVPGLNDQGMVYKGTRTSALGAFCAEGTSVVDRSVNETRLVPCREGDIVIDSSILDPGQGTAIDPSNFEGWQGKMVLTHILYHEKWHAHVYEAAVEDVLEKADKYGYSEKTKQKNLGEAKDKAVGKDSHLKVYGEHLALIKAWIAALQKQKKEAEKRKNTELVETLSKKIKALQDEQKKITESMRKATSDTRVELSAVKWPEALSDANVANYVTYDWGYCLYWMRFEDGALTDYGFSAISVMNEVYIEEAMSFNPTGLIIFDSLTLTEMLTYPDPGFYLNETFAEGKIDITTDLSQAQNLVPHKLDVTVTDGVTGESISGMRLKMLSEGSGIIYETATDEEGKMEANLPPGNYQVKLELFIFGFPFEVHASPVIGLATDYNLHIYLSAFIIPFKYLPALIYVTTIAVVLVAGYSVFRMATRRKAK